MNKSISSCIIMKRIELEIMKSIYFKMASIIYIKELVICHRTLNTQHSKYHALSIFNMSYIKNINIILVQEFIITVRIYFVKFVTHLLLYYHTNIIL